MTIKDFVILSNEYVLENGENVYDDKIFKCNGSNVYAGRGSVLIKNFLTGMKNLSAVWDTDRAGLVIKCMNMLYIKTV